MKPLKEKVSITLDSDIIKKLKDLAEDDDRSFSQYINMVLKEWISKIDETTAKSSYFILNICTRLRLCFVILLLYNFHFSLLPSLLFCHYTVRMV